MASISDDFNRPNNSDLGANWIEVSGDWSIASNQLSPGASGGTIILRAATPMASSDHYAQVTIAATTTASQGVWCRGNANITSGYLWRNSGTSWDLFAVVGGSFVMIGTYAVAAAPGDTARVQAVGSTIKASVNGVQRVSVTNTDVPTGTNVGIRSESVGALRYDDFTAADIAAGATLGTAASTDTAQTLAGAKTAVLSPALQTATARSLVGAKASLLPAAVQTEAAQPLAGTVSRSLDTATTHEAGRPLEGAKNAALAPALETNTARPLVAAGPDQDIDITVGTPHSAPYTASPPAASSWKVGAPC
ncbi:hypothetical protein GCM10010293_40710 [Streptomyces griseoflavus]|uniref:hypothetical protein n=1 Tax=Streptomyces griseoflavus TaxID=35619 RepID=UPI00167D0902|nr:hypothetical protein [Streptomyces griseoflavus]GGV37054.1 hypothetical protein GCM10010293_40710 [Streptomyces griseoflavus]